jgi:hypothetical protein
VPLRAVEALPHPAIVANENFFSHANLVSTALTGLCQALFSGTPLSIEPKKSKDEAGLGKKRGVSH